MVDQISLDALSMYLEMKSDTINMRQRVTKIHIIHIYTKPCSYNRCILIQTNKYCESRHKM